MSTTPKKFIHLFMYKVGIGEQGNIYGDCSEK